MRHTCQLAHTKADPSACPDLEGAWRLRNLLRAGNPSLSTCEHASPGPDGTRILLERQSPAPPGPAVITTACDGTNARPEVAPTRTASMGLGWPGGEGVPVLPAIWRTDAQCHRTDSHVVVYPLVSVSLGAQSRTLVCLPGNIVAGVDPACQPCRGLLHPAQDV